MITYFSESRCIYAPGISIVAMSLPWYASMAEVIIIYLRDTVSDEKYSLFMYAHCFLP